MNIDNMKISGKLLIPACLSGLVILGVGIFASQRLASVAAAANEIITQRDVAVTKSLRAVRNLTQAECFAYVALTDDSNSPANKVAVDGFPMAIHNSQALLEESAALLPEHRDELLALHERIRALQPQLEKAFAIGQQAPGLEDLSKLKPDEIKVMADGAKLLDRVTIELDKISADNVSLNNRIQAENAQLAQGLREDSSRDFWQLMGGGTLAALLTGFFSYWLASTRVVRPLTALTGAMRRLAGGDLDVAVPCLDRGDEAGDMARALRVFKDNAVEKVALERTNADTRDQADKDRTRTEAQKAEASRLQTEAISKLAEGLEMLSRGVLTYRIETAFAPEYERIRVDFNAAIAKLHKSLGVVAANTTAIRSGAQDISSAADDLSRRTEQQAANLEETAAAIGQINDTVRKTSDGAQQARTLVMQAQSEADTSSQVVARAVGAMGDISTSSSKIGSIITVIDEIAFQTNLLALNAGVEAARAGDAGKGFAVVASEVRALAQRSAEAAKEIRGLIQESSAQVETGVDLVGATGAALTRIKTSIGEISTIVQQIAQAATEQAASLGEVNTAVRQMDQVTQQNAAMVEESTAASKSLATESAELARMIGEFEVGGAETMSGPRPVVPAGVPRLRVANGRAASADTGWSDF